MVHSLRRGLSALWKCMLVKEREKEVGVGGCWELAWLKTPLHFHLVHSSYPPVACLLTTMFAWTWGVLRQSKKTRPNVGTMIVGTAHSSGGSLPHSKVWNNYSEKWREKRSGLFKRGFITGRLWFSLCSPGRFGSQRGRGVDPWKAGLFAC